MICLASYNELLTLRVNQVFIIFSCNSESLHKFFPVVHLIYAQRKFYSLTLNEEVDVAEYPLAPETRDTMEPWRRKLDSEPYPDSVWKKQTTHKSRVLRLLIKKETVKAILM